MKRLIVGGLAALAIGLTGCTIAGRPTTASVQPDDFAVDVIITDAQCDGRYAPQAPHDCLYQYEFSVRWLPAVRLPSGMTTVAYTITGGNQPQSGHVQLDGEYPSRLQTYTNRSGAAVMGPTGAVLTGHATYVTVD